MRLMLKVNIWRFTNDFQLVESSSELLVVSLEHFDNILVLLKGMRDVLF